MNRPQSSDIISNGFLQKAFRGLLPGFLFFFAHLNVQASPQDAWQKGNAFYQQKQYDSAAKYFEQIAASKPANAAVFYNLGNAYYRLNRVGPAVLNYRRALKRRPDYPEAKDNLLLAQSRIPGGMKAAPDDIFFLRWWKGITAPSLIMVWSVLSLLFFISLIGMLLYRRLKRGQVHIRPQYVGALVLLWLASLLLAFSSAYAALSDVQVVVMVENTPLAQSEQPGKLLKSIPEGTTLKVLSRKPGRYEIALPDESTGFVEANAVQLVD